ncbi:MAG: recombinase, partial [Peptostreptococcus sp.]|nr:recombinase [Peptostreptococcus sp.]
MAKKINNKSSKPNNIVIRDSNVMDECMLLESQLPPFMKDYFIYLRGAVAVTTRRAYLNDIKFFCNYIIESGLYTNAENLSDISLDDFSEISARDINIFLGD